MENIVPIDILEPEVLFDPLNSMGAQSGDWVFDQ